MSEEKRTESTKYLKMIAVVGILAIIIHLLMGVYVFHANQSCAADSLKAMGLNEGDKVIFLSNGASGSADKGLAYQSYHQLCVNKKFGINV